MLANNPPVGTLAPSGATQPSVWWYVEAEYDVDGGGTCSNFTVIVSKYASGALWDCPPTIPAAWTDYPGDAGGLPSSVWGYAPTTTPAITSITTTNCPNC